MRVFSKMAVRRIAWALVFLILIQAVLQPALAARYQHYVLDNDASIDAQIAEQLQADQAQVLLLGNSFLGEGVDAEQLATLTGQRITKAAIPGSTTPTWYLLLKNVIAPMPTPPHRVVIFFVDSHLTWPDYNLDGNFHLIKPYATPQEPLLAQQLFYLRSSWVEQAVTEFLPTYRFRHQLQRKLYWLSSYWLGMSVGLDAETVDHGENVWSSSDLRDRQLETISQMAQWPVEHLNFADELPRSLLPAMVQIAKEEYIELVFVRLPRRRDYRQGQPVALEEYMLALRAYLAANQVTLLEFDATPELDESYFGVGDHLNARGEAVFTQLLATALQATAP